MAELIAVSGGIDSMCLLEKVRLGEGGPFAAAHCNFGLRGEESDGDEQFVREYCGRYGITLHVKRFRTNEFAEQNGISIEMAARELRYRWFGELCTEFGYSAVLVAHNAQDNAETLILNLLRGTGIKGITGMKEDGFLPVPEYAHIPLKRPLLDMTREEITEYAMEHGLSWREDSTNAENGYKRNKIRNQVFPVFREINPSFVKTLNRDMERISGEISRLRPSGSARNDNTSIPANGTPVISTNGTPVIPANGTPVISTKRSAWRDLIPEFKVSEEPWDGSLPVKQENGILIMDACKVGAIPEFSYWKEGDWIRPLGAPGKKKLQDWFTDHHVPVEFKHLIPLVRDAADESHILAIAGYCIDKKVKVGPATTMIYRIKPIEE